ncbi:mannose-1-phosphate guanylyltransferase [Endozoicomonas montiporae]|uniref:Mannose-1-phosphate guanylyltransferase n=2 Tax=Endozoicomonas montiporae TaxID=1027273 RepID=A0A081N4U2_9GAMM|nr:nucleotidyltransferase family protein [Endozoicomonas montiporae]AMO57663.1 nucleotidyl transferase [Endozoicomonas montiporae CL-33]KEQ13465.1 mannose-1-phosphate guanylyltransferase [Endozoicomonas montiporae]
MKVMILAAGLGKRLRPLTLHKPKPLIEVAGKPLIIHHLEQLAAAGFKDVVINHSWHGDQIVKALGNGSHWGLNIVYSEEPEPLETAGGIIQALPLLNEGNCEDNQPFLVVNGDVFTDYPFNQVPDHIDGQAHLIMVDNPAFKEKGDFALQQGQVQEQGESLLTYSGISVLTPDLFANTDAGVQSLAPVLRQAMVSRNVTGEHFRGLWTDVGTIERLNELEQYLAVLAQ